MRSGFRAVSFASVAVTLRAFVPVNLPRGIQGGFGRSQGILQALVFRGGDPRFVLLSQPMNDQDTNENENGSEKNLA